MIQACVCIQVLVDTGWCVLYLYVFVLLGHQSARHVWAFWGQSLKPSDSDIECPTQTWRFSIKICLVRFDGAVLRAGVCDWCRARHASADCYTAPRQHTGEGYACWNAGPLAWFPTAAPECCASVEASPAAAASQTWCDVTLR